MLTCHDANGKGRLFLPAPVPSQEDIENLVEKVSKRILRFLQRRASTSSACGQMVKGAAEPRGEGLGGQARIP
jgi:hypothetical protein